jgi:hypothetical protein
MHTPEDRDGEGTRIEGEEESLRMVSQAIDMLCCKPTRTRKTLRAGCGSWRPGSRMEVTKGTVSDILTGRTTRPALSTGVLCRFSSWALADGCEVRAARLKNAGRARGGPPTAQWRPLASCTCYPAPAARRRGGTRHAGDRNEHLVHTGRSRGSEQFRSLARSWRLRRCSKSVSYRRIS